MGLICGFPREDYLLISALAVKARFHNRGFGQRLVNVFEKVAKDKYHKINVGAVDNSIYFYESLGYCPFLLIQFRKGDYSESDFTGLKIMKEKEYGKNIAIEVKVEKCDLQVLSNLRKKYPNAWFQYIFTKQIKS